MHATTLHNISFHANINQSPYALTSQVSGFLDQYVTFETQGSGCLQESVVVDHGNLRWSVPPGNHHLMWDPWMGIVSMSDQRVFLGNRRLPNLFAERPKAFPPKTTTVANETAPQSEGMPGNITNKRRDDPNLSNHEFIRQNQCTIHQRMLEYSTGVWRKGSYRTRSL